MKKIYPNIWGRGAIFSYSGLDGVATFDNSMCGNLLAQRVGMSLDYEAIILLVSMMLNLWMPLIFLALLLMNIAL